MEKLSIVIDDVIKIFITHFFTTLKKIGSLIKVFQYLFSRTDQGKHSLVSARVRDQIEIMPNGHAIEI